jgi:hypothetical protein
MATWPGDELAAATAGRGHVRASRADREQVIDTLKAAFAQGMLAKDEFDLLVGQTFASRTYAELAAVTADMPAGLTAAHPLKLASPRGVRPVPRPGSVIMVASVLYAGLWPLVSVLPRGSDGDPRAAAQVVFSATLVYLIVLAIAVGHMVASRREKRSGGQPPVRPAPNAGGQASRRPPSADPGGQLPPVDHGHQRTAEAA